MDTAGKPVAGKPHGGFDVAGAGNVALEFECARLTSTDLMLFVHTAVILNELFFPQTDPFSVSLLLLAFAFCSTFIFRPLIITTFTMAISCIVMATLPTYEQIGITAAWIVTISICRIMQGMSSMGEKVGAELY